MLLADLDAYREMASEMFQSVGQSVGIHVMLLVLEQSIWQIRNRNEDAALIRFSEEGICFDGLDGLEPERAKTVAHQFIMAVFNTLAKLIGKQLVFHLSEQLKSLAGEE